MVLAAWPMPMLAPAEIDIAPVDPLRLDTTLDPEMETVMAPTAVAVCKLMFAPAARAREIPAAVTLVPDALIVCVPGATVVFPLIPMTFAPLLEIVMPGPAENEIDPALVDVPAPTALTRLAGALMPMTLAPLLEMVILLPPEIEIEPTLVDVPAPRALTPAPPPPAAPTIVMDCEF